MLWWKYVTVVHLSVLFPVPALLLVPREDTVPHSDGAQWGADWTRMTPSQRAGEARVRLHHPLTTARGLFISGTFHLMFLDHSWLWVTETMESQTAGKGRGGATVKKYFR